MPYTAPVLPRAALLSEHVVGATFPWSVGVGLLREDDGGPLDLFPEEAAALSPRAVARRRQQFTLGRAAARAALAALHLPPSPILRGEKGEPMWPPGLVGSITHTEGIAIAVVGSTTHYAGLGVDLEPLDPGLSPRAAHLVCAPSELDWAAGDTIRLTMLFCAKEAIFKAVYPLTHVALDFRHAELRWLPTHEAFAATLTVSAGDEFPAGQTLRVTCRLAEGMALATTYVPASPPAATRAAKAGR